ncbi:MAG TPA: YdeI/OmpD-associated family protein [Candidatus Saccharimonadales bacterium]|nr:YdeI/OmpD-associated family protein [Candidatus Saccharimonadales bacterium]
MDQETYKDASVIFFATQDQWEAWLEQHHADTPGVWLKFAKKGSGIPSLNHDLALQVALCFGWIDGQTKGIDETYYLQKFTKRRPKGTWSKRNIGFVEELIKSGKMRPSGQAEIDAAKADGRWALAYDSPTTMTMPSDFQAELDKHPAAKTFYEALNKTNTYAVLLRIQTAKKPETRAVRIQKIITMLEEGKTFH